MATPVVSARPSSIQAKTWRRKVRSATAETAVAGAS